MKTDSLDFLLSPAEPQTAQALKEWQVAVDALVQGETILLLRKGGLRETEGKFAVEQGQVVLYPTYEHQKPQGLKLKYATQVQPVESGWHPETVPIRAWAKITEAFQVSDRDRLMALLPLHIWTEDFVVERFRWKPKQPLSVLLLRVYRLSQPQTIAYLPAYGGCKSWIELAEPINLGNSVPVLDDQAYQARAAEIRAIVAGSQT
ncbi:MAG TPA: DUF1802 family protein [Thermosynechococcaceae cyanobacterium]